MYRDFYALGRTPFHSTPDPAFFFRSASHQAAWETLATGFASRHGVFALVGEPGVGKTLLLRTYLASVPQPARTTLWVCAAPIPFATLARRLVEDLGLPVTTDDPLTLVPQLQQALHAEACQERQMVLILDDAHTLPLETLAQLPCLFALPDGTCLPLQIVLVGQPVLQQVLQHESLRPLAERLVVCATLDPLTAQESRAYIMHRLTRVAREPKSLFTAGALREIVRQSHGVPSALHRCCASALITGFTAQQKPLTVALVRRVLGVSGEPHRRPVLALGLASSAAMVLLAGCLWLAPWQAWQQASAFVPPPPAPVTTAATTPDAQEPPSVLTPVASLPVQLDALATPPRQESAHPRPLLSPAPHSQKTGSDSAASLPRATSSAAPRVAVPAPAVPQRIARRYSGARRGGANRSAVLSQQASPPARGPASTWSLFEARVSTNDDGGG